MSEQQAHLGDLTPDPANLRIHNPRNVGLIADGLQEVGAARSIVVDEDGVILAGNATVEAAAIAGIERVRIVEADGEELIAVRRRGLTPEQKRRLAIIDNRANELSDWDLTALAAVDPGELEGIFTEAELEQLLANLGEPEPDKRATDTVKDPPARTITRRGQLWQLGEHRLLIGDSGMPSDVAAVLDGDLIDLVCTDPPYGAKIGAKNRYLQTVSTPANRVETDMENDGGAPTELQQLLAEAFGMALERSRRGAGWYVMAPGNPLGLVPLTLLVELGILRQTIVWVKNNAPMAALGTSYHWRHEFIHYGETPLEVGAGGYDERHELLLYGWAPKGPHHWYSDRRQDTVWEIDRPVSSPDHPTQKPVELIRRCLEHASRPYDIVYDPFGGSGTTLAVAEELGRRCRMIELEPRYADVILARWVDQTGQHPELIEER